MIELSLEEKIEKASELLINAKYAVALTGAGISVESGIPDFRGPSGLWTKFGEPPMDGYQRFLQDPKAYWERRFRRKGYLKELMETIEGAKPNPGHYALVELERLGILKCLITQNIDNLDRTAGIKNIAEIHGNVTLLRCISCGNRFSRDSFEISPESLPPTCPQCSGIIKGDSVMFGEPIPLDVLTKCQLETAKCDCMLIAGTSATVFPAADFPRQVKTRGGHLIEINLSETRLTPLCDVSLFGKTGEILPKLVERIKTRMKGKFAEV